MVRIKYQTYWYEYIYYICIHIVHLKLQVGSGSPPSSLLQILFLGNNDHVLNVSLQKSKFVGYALSFADTPVGHRDFCAKIAD